MELPADSPPPGRAWSDDEPGLPSCLFLSTEAVAARAAESARIEETLAVERRSATAVMSPAGRSAAVGPVSSTTGSTSVQEPAAVQPVVREAADDAAARAGRRQSRIDAERALFESAAWPEFTAPALGEPRGPMAEVMAAERAVAQATAGRARAVSELAGQRPASADRQPGERGAMSAARRVARAGVLAEVSEWVTRELRIALSMSDVSAERVLVQGLTLTTRLPGTLAALDGGLIHVGHLPVFFDLVDPIVDDLLRARVEAELLRWLAGRSTAGTVTTPAQLREKTHRVMLARDARAQAEELRRALASRGVFPTPEPVAGLSGFYTRLTRAEAEAVHAALGQLADALPDDEPTDGTNAVRRSRAEKMADILVDLVLRRGSSTLPPVQVSLTVVAAVETLLGGDAPGEIAGRTVPAEQVRALLRLLTGVDLAADATTGAESTDADAMAGLSVVDTSADPDSADREPATAPQPATDADEAVDGSRADAGGGTEAGSAGGVELDGPEFPCSRRASRVEDGAFWAIVRHLHDEVFGPPDRPDPGRGSPSRSAPGAGEIEADAVDVVAAAEEAVAAARRVREALEAALGRAEGLVLAAQRAAVEDEETWQATGGGAVDAARAAGDSLDAVRAAGLRDRSALLELLGATTSTSGGGLTHRPRLALVDALTGVLVSLTDLPGLRAAGDDGLGAPPETDGYRPAAALDRFVRTRDRRCRTPGCRRPVRTGELDHHVPHPEGPTSAGNLCGLCLGDHRGKHQAPGWRHELEPDGSYRVSTPSGLAARTAAPPL